MQESWVLHAILIRLSPLPNGIKVVGHGRGAKCQDSSGFFHRRYEFKLYKCD